MAVIVPLLLVLAGGSLCAHAERAWVEERPFLALVMAAPGLALMAMAVIVMALGLAQ